MTFEHQESIYRNYDIRGKYPDQITPEEVQKIGGAIVKKFGCKKVAVGHDIRPSAKTLRDALTKGLTESGCDVIDLGLVTTPMTYFVCGNTDVDASVMITASHMPSEYNGLKIAIEDAKPVDAATLKELGKIVDEHTFSKQETLGVVTQDSPLQKWKKKFLEAHSFENKKLKVVIDPANMIGVLDIDTFKQFEPWIEVYTIYGEFDHTTPNHEANPVKPETLIDLGNKVVAMEADLGIAFDGDADRVGFVDEKGSFVPADLAGTLIARKLLEEVPGGSVVCDLRSSNAVRDVIEKAGGKMVEWKVGHTNIRTKMRELGSVFGIELAGHYYFKETHYSEGGPLPAFLIMEILQDSDKKFSDLVSEINTYSQSGEINSEITRPAKEIFAEFKEKYSKAKVSDLDGMKFVFNDWWFNTRLSANDPVMRLNLEAKDEKLCKEKTEEILKIIRN